MYYLIAPLFSIINLIGIFQIKSIMKIVLLIFKNVIKFYYQFHFKDKTDDFSHEKHVNFYAIFYNNSYNEIVDFNLVMISGFIGNIILKSTGFYITSIIFLFINLGGVLLIFTSEFLKNEKIFENENGEIIPDFKISQILFLLFCYIIFYIGAGGSALLSQMLLNDRFSKLKTYLLKIKLETIELNVYHIRKNFKKLQMNIKNNEKIQNNNSEEMNEIQNSDKNDSSDEINDKSLKFEINENEEEFKKFCKENQSKFDNYFIICFTTIIGYFLKYFINIILMKYKKNNTEFFYYIIGFLLHINNCFLVFLFFV